MYLSVLFFILATAVTSYRIQYFLYSPEHQNEPILIGPNNASRYVQRDYPVRIFIHGWTGSRESPFYPLLKKALFSRGKFYIIQVDFSELAKKNYILVAKKSPEVGVQIADFILNITKAGYPLANIELIGHSIGGQVAGYAGERIIEKTSRKLSKITALDPAGPLFELFKLNGRSLNRSHAVVVFAIHSDRNVLGNFGDVGTTDVYPNGGVGPQPGCPFLIGICSHARSWQYFTNATARPGTILAEKCKSNNNFKNGKCNNSRIIDLGGDITVEDEGRYYLKTNSEPPFKSLIPAGE
ncbi:hypothetical protein Zmor_024896 [Zophobas morio]|uniref:Lipase domain-containing protein n=1 Tax=Zophobas morio TaxID=2755281 RepID=A0AA38HQI6_9CUCU|nr:hypothetical protein Zmor_024896 [Zophobas morio]